MNTIFPCYLTMHEVLLDEIETLKQTSNFNEITVVVENTFVDTFKEKIQNSKFYLNNIVIVLLVAINTYHAVCHPSIVNTVW